MVVIENDFGGNNVINCNVEWHDDEKTLENVNIALFPYDENEIDNDVDDKIFFYCTNVDEYINLSKFNNGEDFTIVKVNNVVNVDCI